MNPVLAADSQLTSNIGQYLTAFSIHSISQFFPGFWSVLLIIAIVLALFLLIIGAIQWITAGDDKERIATARGKVIAAIIGLIIVLSAWIISGLLMDFFGFPKSGGAGLAGQCTDKDGNLGQTCTNTNKCNIAGGCDPACCVTNGDCPGNQVCSIPNGYCKGGKSCWTNSQSHRDCVGNQCVYVPGGGNHQCDQNSDCQ